ncbi:MAG: A24 family peptidase [Bacteriovoracaceae bacterium]
MNVLFSIYAFIFGCLVGSFLNVVILRLPKQQDLVFKRSHCPVCGNQLKWFHNIPVLSFLFLRGKCAFCGTRISWRYPLIELLTGIIAFWLLPDEFTSMSIGLFLFYFLIACIFICHLFIDLDHHLLLDSLNIYLIAIVLPYVLIMHHWSYWVIGGLIGFGGPLLVTWLFYKLRGQIGLGGGDIKLYGILGMLLGPKMIVGTIFFSCFLGALIGVILILSKKMNKDHPMAFGPYIILVGSFQIYFSTLAEKVQFLIFGI